MRRRKIGHIPDEQRWDLQVVIKHWLKKLAVSNRRQFPIIWLCPKKKSPWQVHWSNCSTILWMIVFWKRRQEVSLSAQLPSKQNRCLLKDSNSSINAANNFIESIEKIRRKYACISTRQCISVPKDLNNKFERMSKFCHVQTLFHRTISTLSKVTPISVIRWRCQQFFPFKSEGMVLWLNLKTCKSSSTMISSCFSINSSIKNHHLNMAHEFFSQFYMFIRKRKWNEVYF